METKYILNYESPWLQIVDIEPEGVLCDSNEPVGKNDGLW